jgi:hypothetical protein
MEHTGTLLAFACLLWKNNLNLRSKMLLSDSGSNVLLFLSGHGGDGFLKFRDVSNVQSHDLSDALETMRTQRRFNEMLVLVDTCQAATIPEPFLTPRVTSISSSLRGENSYGISHDSFIGQTLLDRFTHETLQFVKFHGHSGTVSQLVGVLAPALRRDYAIQQTLDVRATKVLPLLQLPTFPPCKYNPYSFARYNVSSDSNAGRDSPAQNENQRLLLCQPHCCSWRSAAENCVRRRIGHNLVLLQQRQNSSR